MPVVYCAGGMETCWWEEVLSDLNRDYAEDCEAWTAMVPALRDPIDSPSGLDSPRTYVALDLAMVRKADLLVAYLEATNPSCIGAAVELGYARGLGIHTVAYVEPVKDPAGNRARAFVLEAADFGTRDREVLSRYLAAIDFQGV